MLAPLLLAPAVLAAAPVRTPSTFDPRIAVEWEVAQDRKGRWTVSGYVHNGSGRLVTDVRLQVEALDANGQVLARTVGYVDQPVPPFGRAYFEVRLPAAAAGHRVSIIGFDFGAGGPSS